MVKTSPYSCSNLSTYPQNQKIGLKNELLPYLLILNVKDQRLLFVSILMFYLNHFVIHMSNIRYLGPLVQEIANLKSLTILKITI